MFSKKKKIIIGVALVALLLIASTTTAVTTITDSNDMFDTYINKIIEFEGGLTDDPNDLGGLTKFGIAKKYYPNVDIANLTVEQAKQIYYNDYWLPTHSNLVSKHIQFMFFDSCVTPGRTWATMTLQRLAGVTVDNRLGPITAAASFRVSIVDFYNARWAHYQQRAVDRPADQTHLKGWKSRCDKSLYFQQQLNSMV